LCDKYKYSLILCVSKLGADVYIDSHTDEKY